MIRVGNRKIKADVLNGYEGKYLLVLKRDGMKCVDCGSNKSLVVHHIDESRKTGDLNNNFENLVTLCKKCHSQRHGFCTSKNNPKGIFILKLRNEGQTFREIGKTLGISRQRAHQLCSMVSSKDTP